MIIKITVESDSEEASFFYEKDVTSDQFEDIKANLEVMMDQYDDTVEEAEEEDEELAEVNADEILVREDQGTLPHLIEPIKEG